MPLSERCRVFVARRLTELAFVFHWMSEACAEAAHRVLGAFRRR